MRSNIFRAVFRARKDVLSQDSTIVNRSIFSQALSRAVPILVLQLPLGVVCGILFKEAGYAWYVASLYSFFVFAATMQFVTLSVMATGGSFWLLAATLIPIGIRNVFYGLTMIERYQKINPLLRGYLAHCLIDSLYSLLQIGPRFDEKEDRRYLTWLSVIAHLSWVLSTLLGSFIDRFIPIPSHLDFVLTASFAAAATEIFLKQKQKRVLGIACVSLGLALLIFPHQLLVAGILFAVSGCLIVPQKEEATA